MSMTDPTHAPQFLRPPSSCGNELERVEWTGTLAVHLHDDLHVGLRFNDESVQQIVEEALGDRVVTGLSDPTPFYSLRMGTAGRRKAAPLHYLYLGGKPVLGTRDPVRLLSGLANHLSAHLVDERDGYVAEAVPVLTPTGMLLVPQEILSMARVIDRVLVPAGFSFADVPHVGLDLVAASVVVPEPLVTISPGVEPLSPLPSGLRETCVAPGRYPLAGWLWPAAPEQVGALRPAMAVFRTIGLLRRPFPDGAQAALDGIAALATQVPITGVAWSSHDDLAFQVLEHGRI